MIDKIIPRVQEGSDEPFIIFRDKSGEWQCDYMQNQYGDKFDWVYDVKENDPLAVEFKSSDFDSYNHAHIFGKVFIERLRADYNADISYEGRTGELLALIKFLEEYRQELDKDTVEYIMRFERPLESLNKMLDFSLISDDPYYEYDDSRVDRALDLIEETIAGLLNKENQREKPSKPLYEMRIIDGYEEKQSVQIAGHLVIFAENAKADEPYMVCFCKWDNPLGFNEYYNIAVTDDYVEALELYAGGINSFAQIINNERSDYEYPAQKLTAADCIQDSLNENLKDKIIVIKPEVLSPEYRRSERQIKICTGGFGASPDSRGNAVFCTDLYSGKKSRFERNDVAGIINPDKLPEWAVKKIALIEAIKEPGIFEFGGYHFKPIRQFRKGEVDRHLKGDSRPWKMDAQYAMRNMSSDRGLGLTKYEWKKAGTDYSHENFFAASGNCNADIFMCIEIGKLYVPCENELFLYKEPPVKENTEIKKKPSLLGELAEEKIKVAAQDVERKTNTNIKKHSKTEVD